MKTMALHRKLRNLEVYDEYNDQKMILKYGFSLEEYGKSLIRKKNQPIYENTETIVLITIIKFSLP